MPYQGQKYEGVPILVFHLPILVAEHGVRPQFSERQLKIVPSIFQELIQQCWAQDPRERPDFSYLVGVLKQELEDSVRSKKLSRSFVGLSSPSYLDLEVLHDRR